MVYDALDQTLFLEVPDGNTGETAVDFEPLDEDTLADETESGDFLHDAVICGLVDGDSVLSLVLDFSLGPLLLLCSFSAARWRGCFSFGLGRIVSASSEFNSQHPPSNLPPSPPLQRPVACTPSPASIPT